MGKRLTDKRDKKRQINLVALVCVLILMPAFSILNVSAASSRGQQYSASSYIYYDDLYDEYGAARRSVNLNKKDGTPNIPLCKLHLYRNQSIEQYNSDIVDLIGDFNKISLTEQKSYLSEMNRVVRALCDYDTGAFIKTYGFIMDNVDPHNEYDCRAYTSEISGAYDNFLLFKSKIHGLSASIGDTSSASLLSPIYEGIKFLWTSIGGLISSGAGGAENASSTAFGLLSYTDISNFADKYSPFLLTLAYLVFIIAFYSNIMDSTVKYDIANPKVLIRLFLRVLVAKILIDGAVNICLLSLRMINDVALVLVKYSSVWLIKTPSIDYYSDAPVIGVMVSSLMMIIDFFPLIIVSVAVGVCCFRVTVKLLIRSFELTCLSAVSPVFFALAAGEHTRKYAERFFVTFLSVAGSIIMIAIIYAIGCDTIAKTVNVGLGNPNNPSNTPLGVFGQQIGTFVAMYAICKFIVKPPKVFSQILAG